MGTRIHITLTAEEWARYQHDPNVLGKYRWDAEHYIRAEHKKWGGDWRDYECRILSPEGSLLTLVTWEPLAVTQARFAKGGR